MRNEVVLSEHVAVVRAVVPHAMPSRVFFAHAAPVDDSAHRAHFGTGLQWGAERDAVQWPGAILQRSLGGDAALGLFMQREAERRLNLLPQDGSLDAVKRTILQQLPTGDVGLHTVAALLGRPSRNLRRELAASGTVYRALVDGLRRQRALELAANGRLSGTAIALMLGFSELSAFSRAWRRWFQQPFRALHG